MSILTPDSTRTIQVGGSTITIKQKIVPASARATKYVASYVQQGQPMKPCAPLAGTGKPKGITIHNTDEISVASTTTPAEQYARATWPNCNMSGVIVHFYVWKSDIWQLLEETEQGWHATDGSSRRTSQRSGETIGGNLDTIAIECIGSDAETERTAALLTAYLLQAHGLNPDTDIYTHNYFYSAKYCPVYILPRWNAFMSMIKGYYNTATGGQDSGAQAEDTVYFLGGKVYNSSTAATAASTRDASSCRLTKAVDGAPHPYHLISLDGAGVYGWVDAASISEDGAPSGVQVGAKVRVTGAKYATGQSIPAYVKNATHIVSQISGDGDRVLLGFPDGICSWVYLKDVVLA